MLHVLRLRRAGCGVRVGHDSPLSAVRTALSRACTRFFFFQAEDGIRDLTVTGVQTCALPILALIGANGAGKTTFLKCLVGLIGSRRGEIRFAGEAIAAAPAERISRLGLSLRSEEHTSELQSQSNLVCRLLLEKKQRKSIRN